MSNCKLVPQTLQDPAPALIRLLSHKSSFLCSQGRMVTSEHWHPPQISKSTESFSTIIEHHWTIDNSMFRKFRMTLRWLYKNSGARTDQNWQWDVAMPTIRHRRTSENFWRCEACHEMSPHVTTFLHVMFSDAWFLLALCSFANSWWSFCNYTASDFAEHGHRCMMMHGYAWFQLAISDWSHVPLVTRLVAI